MNIPENVTRILNRLNENGFESYVVGGCVRDMIMGKAPDDYDVTTNALPDETEKVFQDYKTVSIGKKHGTIGVVTSEGIVEVTTYRIDGEYSDNRHPEKVEFTRNIKDDLSRRDFSVNAMAYDGEKIIDLFGGESDIQSGIIKCVGNPDQRFEEDALRIMRGLRFASVLDFKIDEATGNAMRTHRKLLHGISAERICTELKKLLCGKNVKKILLDYSEIICEVIPELDKCVGFDQRNSHHCFDVYTHSVEAVSSCPVDVITRFAAFFHDIGKPDCFSADDSGVGHFYGHSKISAEKTALILERLKVSNAEKNVITELVLNHDREILCKNNAVKRFLGKVSAECSKRIFDLKRADVLAQAPEYHSRIKDIDEIEAMAEDIVNSNQCVSVLQLAISGKDLIELGVKPSKEMGIILKKLLDKVIDGEVQNKREELIEFYLKKSEMKKCE